MHILYFSWEENCKIDMLDALSRMGCPCFLITAPQNNYLDNPDLLNIVYQAAMDSHCDIIFSFNYLPVVAEAAERAKSLMFHGCMIVHIGVCSLQQYAVLIIISLFLTKICYSR